MEFNEGDLVTRKSHNHDTIFTITSIDADTALLKGINIRLVADSPLDDLELYNDDDSEISMLEKVNYLMKMEEEEEHSKIK